MLTNKQQQNIQTNLQRIILENKVRIVSEIYHSPQMYGMLMENKTTKRPSEEQILLSLFETLLNSEDFMRQNIGILSLDTLTEEQEKIVYSNISESWLGFLKRLGGWIWEGGKWVLRQLDKGNQQRYPRYSPWDHYNPAFKIPRRPDGSVPLPNSPTTPQWVTHQGLPGKPAWPAQPGGGGIDWHPDFGMPPIPPQVLPPGLPGGGRGIMPPE